jgi:hypothetical protein
LIVKFDASGRVGGEQMGFARDAAAGDEYQGKRSNGAFVKFHVSLAVVIAVVAS